MARGPQQPACRLIAIGAWVLLLLVALSGCQIGPDEAPGAPGADAATLVVTAEHGREELLRTAVSPGRSVLRTLQEAADVDTGFGGGFVNRMFDRESDPGATRDWFYFVDGTLSAVGAREHAVVKKQSIWWDFRTWSAVRDPWAVVGAWPAPFAGREVSAEPPFLQALSSTGSTVVDDSPWRIRVGGAEAIERREPRWKQAVNDPERAGLTAVLRQGAVTALSASGDDYVPVADGAAIAAAIPTGPNHTAGVLMVVVGINDADAQRAARRILDDPAVLRNRYAVVFDTAGAPIFAAGQGAL